MPEGARLIVADCRDAIADLPDASVDAVVCDPPYEISFMSKRWDGTGIAYNTDLWRDVLRVLKPGGHLLAFGGTRTYHRLACAIEDAGFEIRDSIHWVYGSGFPKSLDVSKAIDKAAGAEREVVGSYAVTREFKGRQLVGNPSQAARVDITAPATDDAARWQGWGTALKPAHEPIVVARKPLAETVAQTVLAHGTGALNIDGCRVGTEQTVTIRTGRADNATSFTEFGKPPGRYPNPPGRWPPNFLLTHAEGCEETCVEGCPTAFEESRFFPAFRYQAKASRRERNEGLDGMPEVVGKRTQAGGDDTRGRPTPVNQNHHPTVKPVELMRWLCRLVTPPGGVVLDPFTGSGTTGVAAVLEGFDFIGVEREPEYAEIAERRIAHAQADAEAAPVQLAL